MSSPATIRIVAQVGESERAGMAIGAELLGRSLLAARIGVRQDVSLTIAPASVAAEVLPEAHVHIASLLPELQRPFPPADLADRMAALQARAPLVFLCTIFRHVSDRDRTGGANDLLVRIRALNLMAIELSHALGVRLIDVDRVLAYFGGRPLGTDYRLGGPVAPGVVGHAMATAILSGGLDDLVDPLLQDKAKASLGGPERALKLARLRAEGAPRG